MGKVQRLEAKHANIDHRMGRIRASGSDDDGVKMRGAWPGTSRLDQSSIWYAIRNENASTVDKGLATGKALVFSTLSN